MFATKLLLLTLACFTFASLEAAGECAGTQFTCTNGQCIGLDEKCDGKDNCGDGSDESAKECSGDECPEYTFRCAYGACIDKSLVCNNERDCWDNSDENELNCLKTEEETDKYFKKLQGDCGLHSMECPRTGECIEIEKICDGVADCRDKSDETVSLCYGLECPDYAFKCGYGACINPNLVCNHVADCVDNSDENPEICFEKKRKWQLWKAEHECYPGDKCKLNAEGAVVGVPKDKPSSDDDSKTNADSNDSNKEKEWFVVPAGEIPIELKSCVLPNSKSLQAFDYTTEAKYLPGSSVPSQTLVSFRCPYQQLLVGKEYNACYNGKWQVEFPQCERLCLARYAIRGISTSHTCIYKNNHVDCTQPARPGTIVQYACASHYHSSATDCLKEIQCNDNGKWSGEPPRCTPICGDKGDTKFDERPWLVSIYKRIPHDEYNLTCYGVVVSPKLVVSVGKCFNTTADANQAANDRLSYHVAEGKQLSGFHENSGHGLRLHNVSHLLFPKISDGLESYQLALLKIVDYFQFSARLSPICIHPKNKGDLIKQENIAARQGEIIEIDEDIEGEIRTFLSKIVDNYYPEANTVDVLDIGYFRQSITSQITNSQFIL